MLYLLSSQSKGVKIVEKPIIDSFGRKLYYLRLSVTDKCQFSCTYCGIHSRDFLPQKALLTFEEIKRVLHIFKSMGTKKVRFTGGEPLMNPDIGEMLRYASSLGLKTALTTNGFLLRERWEEIEPFIDSVNISLDSVNPSTFAKISSRDQKDLQKVTDAIELVVRSGTSVKINTVIVRENAREIDDIIDFSKSLKVPIRFIEYMNVKGNEKETPDFEEIQNMLMQKYSLLPMSDKIGDGPALYYRTPQGMIMGFISYSSPHFCDGCNKVRITSDGKLRLCLVLGIELSLRDLLRNDMTDDGIESAIRAFVMLKPFSHGKVKILKSRMNSIGG